MFGEQTSPTTTVHGATRIAACAPLFAAVMLILSNAAVAGNDEARSSTPDGSGYIGLDEVTVTARKRAESVQDIPVSVTVISEADIRRNDFSNLEKIAASTPQFTIARASNGSGAQLSLRGIGSNFTSIGIEQSVATVVDGVYYGQGRVINEGLFDLARIELLKGPQSLFFGKNSTAGVISITTADPTETTEFIGRIGYEFKARQPIIESILSTPLTDTLGVRVAVKASKMSRGYVRNVAGPINAATFDVATGTATTLEAAPAVGDGPHEKEVLARATLKWQPSAEFSATLKAAITRNRNDNASWNYIIFDCPDGGPTFEPGSPCGRNFRNAQNAFPKEMAANFPLAKRSGRLANDYDSQGVTATLSYDADSFNVTSVTNFNTNKNIFVIDGDYYSSATSNIWTTELDKFRAFSSEARLLTSFDGPLNILGGVYYQRTRLSIYNIVNIAGVEDSTVPPELRYVGFDKRSHTRGETVAGFGQLIWKVIPEVELTAGVRYTHETKKSAFVHPYVNTALSGVFVAAAPFGSDQEFDNWSPEFTASYQPTDDITVYAAYKTGYKSGGFSNTAILSTGSRQEDFDFGAEKARGYEAGVKATLLDRQLRVDLGVYNYKFSDLQVDFFNSATISFVTTNAGAARTKGVELAAEFAPHALAGLRLRGTVNYNKATYANYLAPCYAGQTPAKGCTLSVDGVLFQDLSGKATANAPRWTASVGASYDTPLTKRLLLGVSADARYSDEYLASAFGNPIDTQGSYVNLDAAIRLATMDDRWEFAVIGRNLTNHFVLTGGFDVAGTGSGTGTANGRPATQVGLATMPRTVQAQVTYRF